MKKFITYLVCFCMALNIFSAGIYAEGTAAFQIWTASGIEKILQTQLPPDVINTTLQIEAAKNEYESGQVIIRATTAPINNATVSVSDLVYGTNIITSPQISVYKEHYVHVTETTTGAYPTGWYPDALIPLTGANATFNIAQGNNQGLLFTVKVPKGVAAGLYQGTVTITRDGISTQVPLKLTVYDFELTDESHSETAFAIWPDKLLAGHPGIVKGSQEHINLIKDYYNFFLDYRVTPTDLPISNDNSLVDVDTFVTQAKEILKDPRITAYRIPFYYTSPGVPDLTKTQQLVDKLKVNGIFDKGYFYLGGEIDEPSISMYPLVKERCSQIAGLAPDARNLVTVNITPDLNGYVNTWCPILSNFPGFTPAKIDEVKAKGEHVWWYTCVAPKNPFPSYHIDDNLVGARALSWMQKYYNVEGNLYWSVDIFDKYNGTQYVPRDIWNDPKAFPGANGDGFLCYPGTEYGINGPIATLRLEAIRDGNEDYEYLWLLEKKMNEAAQALGITDTFKTADALKTYYDRVFKAVNQYNPDASNLLEVRREIANEIVNLDKNPKALVTFGQATETEAPVTIYTELGATVTVNGAPATGVALTTAQAISVTIPCSPGLNTINIKIEKDGNINEFIKPFEIESAAPLYPAVMNACETEDDLAQFTTNDATVSLSDQHVTQGTSSVKEVIGTTNWWPGVNVKTKFADWTKFKTFDFDIFNENDQQVKLYVKFWDKDGKNYDNNWFFIDPQSSMSISIPMTNIKNVDLTKMDHVELWMNQAGTPITLYYDNFRLMSDTLYNTKINYCETAEDAALFTGDDIATSLSDQHVTQGAGSMKAVIGAYGTSDWPTMRYEIKNEFIADWTKFCSFDFDLYNDNDSQAKVFVKFYDKDGAAYDNNWFIIDPKSSSHISIPMTNIKNIDLSRMGFVDIWMNKGPGPYTIYFDNFNLKSAVQYAPDTAIKIKKVEGGITLDGQLKEIVWNLNNDINIKLNDAGTDTDNTAQFATLYDDQNLYFGFNVKDPNVVSSGAEYPWNDDAVEIYIDGNLAKGTYDNNTVQYVFRFNDENVHVYGNSDSTKANVTHKSFKTADGYSMEIAIPWATLGVSPVDGKLLGITAHIDDKDVNDAAAVTDRYLMFTSGGPDYATSANWAEFTLTNDIVKNVEAAALNKASGDIVIDGNINESGWVLNNQLNEKIDNPAAAAKFGTLWDENNIYFAFDVTDSYLSNTNSDPWDDDSVEIYVDGDWTKGLYNAHTAQFIFRWNDSNFYRYENGSPVDTGKEGIQYKMVQTATGYALEVAIPWTDIGVTPADGRLVALTAHVNDRTSDTGSASGNLLFSPYSSNAPDYNNSKNWADFRLTSAQEQAGIVVSNPVFKDIDGVTVDKLNPGTFIKVAVNVKNNSAVSSEAIMIVALYDSNGALKNLSSMGRKLKADEKLSLYAGLNLPGDTTGYFIKTFVWDSLENQNPISNVIVFPAAAAQ